MKRRISVILALVIMLSALAGCVQAPAAPAAPDQAAPAAPAPAAPAAPAPAAPAAPAPAAPAAPAAPSPDDTSANVTLNMAVFYDANVKMTYMPLEGNARPTSEYAAADGVIYRDGDFKPVWKELQNRLNFTINDVTPADASVINDAITSLTASNFQGVDIMVGNAQELFTREGVTNGTFLRLDEYLDIMPNFKQFLDENSIVKLTVTAGDGHIYFSPYFDGYNDLERMIMLRADWVKKLLDDDAATYDTGRRVETHYTPYMPESFNISVQAVTADGSGVQTIQKNVAQNVITVQNNLSRKDGANLTQALKDHIDAVYGSTYANRSDLFIGQDAAYDADELVALMRCVLANPMLLTGQDELDTVPLYPRYYTAGRYVDLFRMMEIWGVRGLDSRREWLFTDVDGTLKEARMEPETMDGLERLNMLYKEGLILKDFDRQESTEGLDGSEHRGKLNTANLGFATFDYNQTTTVLNSLDQTIEGFDLRPVLPPVADWDDNGQYYQFTDSWRSVKDNPGGWAILATVAQDEAKLMRALKLFDYLYSPEGNRLMSYGPEPWIDGTIMYGGKEVPKLSQAALTELAELAGGNYTNYYRMWLGGTFPIGYVKEQGMEYQTVHPKGQFGLDQILRASELGTMRHVVVDYNDAQHPGDYLMPTIFATLSEEEAFIRDNCTELATAFRNANNDEARMIFADYVLYGFEGTTPNGDTLLSKEGLIAYIRDDLMCSGLLEVYTAAFNRMMGQ